MAVPTRRNLRSQNKKPGSRLRKSALGTIGITIVAAVFFGSSAGAAWADDTVAPTEDTAVSAPAEVVADPVVADSAPEASTSDPASAGITDDASTDTEADDASQAPTDTSGSGSDIADTTTDTALAAVDSNEDSTIDEGATTDVATDTTADASQAPADTSTAAPEAAAPVASPAIEAAVEEPAFSTEASITLKCVQGEPVIFFESQSELPGGAQVPVSFQFNNETGSGTTDNGGHFLATILVNFGTYAVSMTVDGSVVASGTLVADDTVCNPVEPPVRTVTLTAGVNDECTFVTGLAVTDDATGLTYNVYDPSGTLVDSGTVVQSGVVTGLAPATPQGVFTVAVVDEEGETLASADINVTCKPDEPVDPTDPPVDPTDPPVTPTEPSTPLDPPAPTDTPAVVIPLPTKPTTPTSQVDELAETGASDVSGLLWGIGLMFAIGVPLTVLGRRRRHIEASATSSSSENGS